MIRCSPSVKPASQHFDGKLEHRLHFARRIESIFMDGWIQDSCGCEALYIRSMQESKIIKLYITACQISGARIVGRSSLLMPSECLKKL